jgi:hypothetical protein
MPLGDVLKGILDRLGVGDLDQWEQIRTQWAEVAGSPWNRQTVPIALTDGVLVVEAVTPGAVAMLKYGVPSLKKALCDAYGVGVVTDVRIKAPRGHRQR